MASLMVVTPNNGAPSPNSSTRWGCITIDPQKRERLDVKLEPALRADLRGADRHVETLTREQAVQAALMGPTASHASEAELESRASRLPDSVDVSVSVRVLVFAHRRGAATT